MGRATRMELTVPRPINPEILTEQEVAPLLGLCPGTLRSWRSKGKGPKYLKLEGAVRYRLADILKFMESGQ